MSAWHVRLNRSIIGFTNTFGIKIKLFIAKLIVFLSNSMVIYVRRGIDFDAKLMKDIVNTFISVNMTNIKTKKSD
jgi:hypothetical protein